MTSTTTIADVATKISGVTNRGAWTSTPTSSGKVTIPAGYHSGSGYVDTSKVYNAGKSKVVFNQHYGATSPASGYYTLRSYKNNTTRTMIMIVSGCGNGDALKYYSGASFPTDFETKVFQGTWNYNITEDGRQYYLEVAPSHTAYFIQWMSRCTGSLTVVDFGS